MKFTFNRIQDFLYENWKIFLACTLADTKFPGTGCSAPLRALSPILRKFVSRKICLTSNTIPVGLSLAPKWKFLLRFIHRSRVTIQHTS